MAASPLPLAGEVARSAGEGIRRLRTVTRITCGSDAGRALNEERALSGREPKDAVNPSLGAPGSASLPRTAFRSRPERALSSLQADGAASRGVTSPAQPASGTRSSTGLSHPTGIAAFPSGRSFARPSASTDVAAMRPGARSALPMQQPLPEASPSGFPGVGRRPCEAGTPSPESPGWVHGVLRRRPGSPRVTPHYQFHGHRVPTRHSRITTTSALALRRPNRPDSRPSRPPAQPIGSAKNNVQHSSPWRA